MPGYSFTLHNCLDSRLVMYHVITWLSCDYHRTITWLVTIMWLSYTHYVTIMWLVMWLSCDRLTRSLAREGQSTSSMACASSSTRCMNSWWRVRVCGREGKRNTYYAFCCLTTKGHTHSRVMYYLKMWLVHNMHTRSTFDHVITYCKSEEVWCLMTVELSIERLCQEPISELWTLKKRFNDKLWTVLLYSGFFCMHTHKTKCELKTAPGHTFNLKYLDHLLILDGIFTLIWVTHSAKLTFLACFALF